VGFVALAAAVVGFGLLGTPPPTTATAPTHADVLPALEFATEIQAGQSPSSPVTIAFPVPMDPDSVAASLRVQPETAVDLEWDATGALLTVRPRVAWAPATYHTLTVDAGALEASGRPLVDPVRAAFLTRDATAATIEPTSTVGGEALTGTDFVVRFERPIDVDTLRLTFDPGVGGTIEPAVDADVVPTAYRFVPSRPLAPGTSYHVALADGVRDMDGAPVAAASLEVRTAGIPAVVRFRPRADTTGVSRTQVLSVRFTEPMDHATTEAAWSATIGGSAVSGTFTWAEGDTVLVFHPSAAFDYSKQVVMSVAATATSHAGVALSTAASATFTTIAKPRPAVSSVGSSHSVGAGTWGAVEGYYLGLLNCTRQGGWVTSSGSCSSPGGSGLNALILDAGISDSVARPYAQFLATRGLCSHYANGSPSDRLRRAGYTSAYSGENLGCRSGDPYAAVLASHLYFQSESSYNGGHWWNIMRPVYTRVGIGVWVASGRVRLVCDFYWPG
jgi:uncharacterized protein YkwD